MMMMKTCTKCGKEYPATLEYFYADKRYKDGLIWWCRECRRRASKKYRNTIIGYLRNVFNNIEKRCNDPGRKDYKNYGGRGIQNKFKSSDEFVNYVINELQIDPRGLDVDRIDNDGHYEPGNIRFITRSENLKNRRGWKN